MLQATKTPPQAAKGEEIKNLFRQAYKLHRAGYHQVKIIRTPGNVVILQELHAT